MVSELRGEKIDIIPWTPDIARFSCFALAPAEVNRVYVDNDEQSLEIIVPDDQLSLAIGKKGQNVRLAAKLTGWKIDIKSETRAAEAQAELDGNDEGDGLAEDEELVDGSIDGNELVADKISDNEAPDAGVADEEVKD